MPQIKMPAKMIDASDKNARETGVVQPALVRMPLRMSGSAEGMLAG